MNQLPQIEATVTFLGPDEGGRSRPARDSPLYRPHLVVGDPNQRQPVTVGNVSQEDYLGVTFTGDGRELTFGVPHDVTLSLIYHPRVDYDALRPGATFTIREGGRIVGYGEVTADPSRKELVDLASETEPAKRAAKQRRYLADLDSRVDLAMLAAEEMWR